MRVCVWMCAYVWVRRFVFLSKLCSGDHACQTSPISKAQISNGGLSPKFAGAKRILLGRARFRALFSLPPRVPRASSRTIFAKTHDSVKYIFTKSILQSCPLLRIPLGGAFKASWSVWRCLGRVFRTPFGYHFPPLTGVRSHKNSVLFGSTRLF